MPINITMPALSPTMEEGTLAKWLVKPGDAVGPGDVIAEIETDKATMEVEAVDEGRIAKIFVEEGSEGVKVNSVIAVLAEDGEDLESIEAPPATPSPIKAEAKVETPAPVQPSAPVVATPAAAPSASTPSGGRVFASPLAKRIAAEKGLDLSTIQGTGPRGRIVKADVINAKPGAPKVTATAASPDGLIMPQILDDRVYASRQL